MTNSSDNGRTARYPVHPVERGFYYGLGGYFDVQWARAISQLVTSLIGIVFAFYVWFISSSH